MAGKENERTTALRKRLDARGYQLKRTERDAMAGWLIVPKGEVYRAFNLDGVEGVLERHIEKEAETLASLAGQSPLARELRRNLDDATNEIVLDETLERLAQEQIVERYLHASYIDFDALYDRIWDDYGPRREEAD